MKVGYKIENQNIVFSVINSGYPIDGEMRNKILEAFYKQYTITDKISDGLGIGLR